MSCTNSYLTSDAPNVELVLGKSISAESIYEGGDVYFDCRVHSSPPPDRVNWYHNVSGGQVCTVSPLSMDTSINEIFSQTLLSTSTTMYIYLSAKHTCMVQNRASSFKRRFRRLR